MKFSLQRSQRGVALVIVLTFVVLVTGLIVAYFSRSITDRQISNSSFNASKADILGRSAADIIISDLKQEIVNGSKAPTTVGNSVVYMPTSNATFLPARKAPSTIPNLIRRSGDDPAAPAVSSRASVVNSETSVSINGRFVSKARWNSHYLIPRFDMGDTVVDSTPDASANFTAPDWVLVTDQGPKVLTQPSNAVVGRYAYAIYDEGGLLDLNAAGYPADPATGGSNGLSVADTGRKGSLALADLTQLPIVKSPGAGVGYMTQSQVNNIVGWRNYASAQLTAANGSFSAFTFSALNANNWLINFATNNKTGFLSACNSISGTPPRTDQALLSRRQLLRLRASLGISQNALQYLGTFSRDLSAPSFYYPATLPTGSTNDPIENSTNSNILTATTLRMASAGTANDGFTWKAGDSVVGRRFSLARLAMVSFSATDASSTSDIHKYFGLTRASDSDPWVYCGSDSGTTMAKEIKSLDQVAAAGREPNFFELLKAAIHKDSVGVSYGFPTSTGTNDKSRTWVANADAIDKLPDLQILRIGANIIDQADKDSYPTVIAYQPATTILYAYGIESLPYISALGFRSVCDHYNTMVDPGGDPANPLSRKLRDQIVPALWNPHRNANNTSSDVPTSIQFYVTGKTRWYLIGDDTRNDDEGYKNSGRPRGNEIGLSGFDTYLPAATQNGGFIVIGSSQYSSFLNPNLILKAGSAVYGSGAYGELPFHTNGTIFGLTLQNAVYPSGREPTTAENTASPGNWNGYFRYQYQHHFLNPGAEGLGINAVLRYEYPPKSGQYHVYNAFASNEADPNGKIHTDYDAFGICASNPNQDGIFMWLMDHRAMPPSSTDWKASGGSVYYDGLKGQNAIRDNRSLNLYFLMKADPRTARFGIGGGYNGWTGDEVVSNLTASIREPSDDGGKGHVAIDGVPSNNSFRASTATGSNPAGNPGKWWPSMWSLNLPPSGGNGDGTYTYDLGPSTDQHSGVVRPGDDYLSLGFYGSMTAVGTNNSYQNTDSKPVMLNRPFRSVGELGYVFRDMPYKTLDLFSLKSADAGLLDFFTVDVAPTSIVAGKVNINTRQKPVLLAMMNGVLRKEDPNSSIVMGTAAASTIAADLLTATAVAPMQNKAELVTKFSKQNSDAFTASTTSVYPVIKSQREAPIRALAEAGSSRVWNLLVDVIAQTGRYPSSATSLDKFSVEGERRYWLHVAIDRYTGKVVDQQLEPVYE